MLDIPSTSSTNDPTDRTSQLTQRGIRASADALSPQSVTSRRSVTSGRSATSQRSEFGSGRELEAVVVEAGRVLHSSRCRLVRALAAFDDDGGWALSGAHSCAQWAAGTLGVSVGTAREWLRVGHALAALPAVEAAMADGRLSYCAVRTLTRVAVDHPDAADELVELAARSLPGELGRDLARWAKGHDSDEQREDRERDQTYLSWRVEPDGMAITRWAH